MQDMTQNRREALRGAEENTPRVPPQLASECVPEFAQAQLAKELVARTASIRRYVAAHIPARFSSLVSPDDVLQEMWIRAFRAWPTFCADDPAAIDRWLTRVANTSLISILRGIRAKKRGVDVSRTFGQMPESRVLARLFQRVDSTNRSPSGNARRLEANQIVRLCVGTLPDDRRQVIELRYLRGWTVQEVADATGKTQAAVSSLLYNALRELRQLMGNASRFLSE